ncbi:DNA recombination protein RmuC [compost metagenome]
MKKLSEGRGNLIAQTEGFRQMGVEVKRPINPRLVGQALPEADDEEDDDDAPPADEAGVTPEALTRRVNE